MKGEKEKKDLNSAADGFVVCFGGEIHGMQILLSSRRVCVFGNMRVPCLGLPYYLATVGLRSNAILGRMLWVVSC